MSHLGILEPGNRHDLRVGISPDAPDESQAPEEAGDSINPVPADEETPA